MKEIPNLPIPVLEIDSSIEFYSEVNQIYNEAKDYLKNFKWCNKIYNGYLYFNMGSTLCIFLFNIENNQSSEDNEIWVVIGDIPTMYLDTVGATSIKEVLSNYIDLASDWIFNVLNNKTLEDSYPFNTEPTKENALLLQSRINFMKNNILENIEDLRISNR